MMKWNYMVIIGLSAVFTMACGGDVSEDSDAGLTGDYGDAGVVDCDGEPASCEEIGDQAAQYFGCCFGDVLYYCEGDSFTEGGVDCASDGAMCGYNPQGDFMDCIY